MEDRHKSSAAEETDEALVARCQAEAPYVATAFELIVRRYEPIVYRSCLKYLKDAMEAEEAAQDVFVRVFFNIGKFQGRSSFKTWLFRIVVNACASRYRTLRRLEDRRRAYARAVELSAVHEPSASRLDLDGGLLSEALENLSAADREILILRHVSELSFQEISETLRLGLSASKMRLYRAEFRLRAAVEGRDRTE